MSIRTLTVLSVAVVMAAPLVAQCPDGSPPPCPGQRSPFDPNRIAILPFRITASDTLLGQGIAELLAPDFTGEGGPVAINMGTVLRVWRRDGGRALRPLAQAQERQLAAELGAGKVVEGSIVGLGRTITLSASVLELPQGTIRHVGPVAGAADSLQFLVGRLGSTLLGATGASVSTVPRKWTDSLQALHAFLEGLSQERSGNMAAAAAAFERAFALDSLFVDAARERRGLGGWGVSTPARWDTLAARFPDRLSPQERVLASLDDGVQRSPEDVLARYRHVVALLPETDEPQLLLGDWIYHWGSSVGISDNFLTARRELERAYRLDSGYEPLIHLLEIGWFTADSGLVRRSFAALRSLGADTTPRGVAYSQVTAVVLRDRALAVRYATRAPRYENLGLDVTMACLPAEDVARLFDVSRGARVPGPPSVVSDSDRSSATTALHLAAINTGRLAWVPDVMVDSSSPAHLVAATLELTGDSVIASAGERTRASLTPDTAVKLRPLLAAARAVLDAVRRGTADLRPATTRLDSMVRWNFANTSVSPRGFEGLLLSVAWERLGEPARALSALQLDWWGLGFSRFLLVPVLRREGALATAIGDTTRAIRAYRRYLAFRRDADPILRPQRDSVAAELARLESSHP